MSNAHNASALWMDKNNINKEENLKIKIKELESTLLIVRAELDVERARTKAFEDCLNKIHEEF